jgi:hypothetical protein
VCLVRLLVGLAEPDVRCGSGISKPNATDVSRTKEPGGGVGANCRVAASAAATYS